MSIYLILFLSGAIGIAAMALLGMNRHSNDGHGGHAHGHGHGHDGHAGHHAGHQTTHHHGGHGHDHGHSQGHNHGQDHGHGGHEGRGGRDVVDSSAAWTLPKYLFLVTPMDVFATAFAAGAAGLLLKNAVSTLMLPWIAGICGLAFAYGVVRPLFGLAQKFASKPSEGLEGTVTQTATAISRFDAQGRGLVRVIFDNEETQCLAILDHDDLLAGTQILKGDQVVILEVDPVKNSCRVSKI